MKIIVIANKELPKEQLSPFGGSVIFKKNKTIFKEPSKEVTDFLKQNYPNEFRYYIEEWEFVSEKGFQAILSNTLQPMRPLHVVSSDTPPHGFKALFQVETLTTFSYFAGKWAVRQNTVSPSTGWGTVKVIAKGTGDNIELILNGIMDPYKNIFGEAWNKWQNILKEKRYSIPMFADLHDRVPVA